MAVAVLIAGLWVSQPAHAVIARTRPGHIVSYQPTRAQAPRARGLAHIRPLTTTTAATSTYKPCSSSAAACLTYHGGPIMRTATLTAVFWNPSGLGLSYPTGYQSEIEQFLTDVATDSAKETNFYSVLTQYYEGVGANTTPVTYAVTSGAALQTTDPLPSGAEEQCTTPIEGTSRPCVTDKGIRTELNALIKEKGLATGIGHEYVVFFPPGIDSCFDAGGAGDENCSGAGYCGYHGALASGTPQEVEYANEPDNGDAAYAGGCTAIEGKSAAFQTINTTSHEVSESVTDPEVEEPALSWYDANTLKTTVEGEELELEYGEVGDICAWEFKQGDGALGIFSEEGFETAPSNQAINNKAYLLQTEWDNAHSTCSISEETASTKAAFTVSPGSAVSTDEPVSVDPSPSHAPVPIKTYEWNWGDGTSTSSSTATTVSHSYTSTEGLQTKNFTVTLTVTDENGNKNTTTQTVEIKDRTPTAAFSLPASLTAGDLATFDGSSSSDPDGTIVSYSWSFGDGATASGAQPSHTYTTAGEHTVELTVTDNAGSTASVSHLVTVAPAPSAPGKEPSSEGSPGEGSGSGTTRGETTTNSGTSNGTTTTSSTSPPTTPLPASSQNTAFATIPSNAMRITAIKQNRRKGAIALTITVAGPGALSITDAAGAHASLAHGGLLDAIARAVALISRASMSRAAHKPLVNPVNRLLTHGGRLTLQITPTQAGRSLLTRKHRLTVRVLIVFTPTGGVANTTEKALHLRLSRGRKRRT